MSIRRVEPGTRAAEIVEEEERLLARVEVHLAGVQEDGGPLLDYDRELIELRDAIAEAKPEDVAPLVEQMARVQAIAARRGRSRALPVDPMSPYFAHMRLRETKSGREKDVLIGKRGFHSRGPSGETVNIVDWRNAPVSRIYYRYDEGDDYDEEFDGHHLDGVVAARRNVTIAQGKLRRIGSPEGTFARGAAGHWVEAVGEARPVLQGGQGTASRPPRPEPQQKKKLGVHSGGAIRADKHLPEIAALIDREQFDLITSPTSGLVLIQGGAGSGKTTVALHRVAYLSFADPKTFKPKKMLVVVPSHALSQYVAGVLPSLGVEGVPVHTFRHWARTMRKKLVPKAGDRYADDTPEAVTKVKKHPALLDLLERSVVAQGATFRDELAREIPDAPEILARWDELSARPLVSRVRRMITWLEKQGDAISAANRHRAENVLRRMRRRAGDVIRDWEEVLTDHDLLRAGFDARATTPGDGTLAVTDDELRQTVKWVARQKDVPAEEEYAGVDEDRLVGIDDRAVDADTDQPEAGLLDEEDDPLLLRLHQLKHGGLIVRDGQEAHETRYEHIAIDEAQDFSAVAIKVLLEATSATRSVTIAGDTAQRLVFDNSFHGWRELLSDAGHTAVEVRPLKLSYRSTAEVMRFARAILGPLADPDEPLVARSGAPVALHRWLETGEAVAFLGDALRSLMGREPTASVAIICRHPEQADVVHGALLRAEVPALRRVRREDFAFAPGIDVTDVTQVKGLEFDYVIIWDVTAANYPDTLEARHMLHIAATRAAHQLWLVATAEPSPLLPGDLLTEDLL